MIFKKVKNIFKRIQIITIFLFLFSITLNVTATNWYVRPTSQGSSTGADWNNAWSLGTLNWSSVKPGDTIWMAGGTYGNSFAPASSGNSTSLIYIKRVRTTDSAPISAAGWNNSFDSQVIVNPPAGSLPAAWTQSNVGSYLYIDGRVDSGISFQLNIGTDVGLYPGAVTFLRGNSFITFTNVEMAGPAPNSAGFAFKFYQAALSAVCWNGSSYDTLNNIVVSHCRLHGAPDMVVSYNLNNVLFEYCKIYDNNAAGSTGLHCNLFEYHNGNNFTLRYSDISTWSVEGFRPYSSVANVYMYGNVWHDAIAGTTARVIEPDAAVASGWGPIYFYNNVVANIPGSVFFSPTSQYPIQYSSLSQTRNNIFWNAGIGGAPNSDYDYSNTGLSETHGISATSNPFVNMAGGDYHIVSTTGNSFPRNKGVALPSPYNVDMDGNVRGADGAWDIGAYEYGSSNVVILNPLLSVTPASQNFGTVVLGNTTNQTFTVINAGTGNLVGSVNASTPFNIVSGTSYNLSEGQSQITTIQYNPTSVGTNKQTVVFTGNSNNISVALSGIAITNAVTNIPPITNGLSFSSTSGTITSPFIITNGYIYQNGYTGVTNGGTATYTFNITNAGNYVIKAMVSATDISQDSFYVNIDSIPVDPNMVWKILPLVTGTTLQNRVVCWQGNGLWNNPQFVPQVFNLTSGTHKLIIIGREANTKLGNISIVPALSSPKLK